MKFIKFLFISFIVLLLLVIIAAVAIPLLVNPNDYKEQIQQQVKQQTGRDLKISGDIDVSLGLSPSYLPTALSFELGETELGNLPAFSKLSNKPFVKVKRVSVNVSVLPLVQENKLEVGKVILDQANIFLLKNQQGKANWENIVKEDTSTNKQAEKTTGNNSTRPMPEIEVEGVEIIDSIVRLDDFATNQHINLDKITLKISQLKENIPVNIRFNTNFNTSFAKDKADMLDGKMDLATSAIINLGQQNFKLNNTKLDLTTSGSSIPGGKNSTSLSANIELDLAKQLLNIEQMVLDSYQLNLKGQLNVAKLLGNPQFNSQFALAEFSPKELAKQLNIELPEMKNPNVLNSVKVKLQLQGNSNQIKLNSLDAVVDEITIKGNAAINNLKQPSYQIDLDINKINLDDYAIAVNEATADKKQAETSNKPAPTAEEQPIIPVDLLKSLNVNGRLKIAELIGSGIKMSQIILGVKGKDGLLTLDPVQSDFYKGKLQLKTSVDVRKKTPKLEIEQNFSQIDLGQLLQDATGTQEFTGTANISSQITSSGNFQQQLIKNANGNGNFVITDGHIAKLDILNSLRKADALLKGRAAPTEQQQENTKFTELKGSVEIKNGVVHNQDLSSVSPVMRLGGAGYADLPKQYLDYTLKVTLLNSLNIDAQSNATDYKNKEFPYTIKGKFSDLSKKANIKDIVKKQVKAEAKKQLSKKLDKHLESDKGKKLKEKIGEENLNKLKGLLKF